MIPSESNIPQPTIIEVRMIRKYIILILLAILVIKFGFVVGVVKGESE